MGDNVDVARALALVHVHTARALFFIILIILKAKLIFLIYLCTYDDPIFFEALIAKGFKMHCTDTKKNQERIAEKRELHRQKKENNLMGLEDISPLVT